MSISFDRAADYYDATRGLPGSLMEQLVDILVAELPRQGACLEIGIGTGRIALPLLERGVDVVGVDISTEMLRRLMVKRAGVRVVVADATRLPFPDRSFSAAIAAHVLHLIPSWHTALDELQRVVEPGGVVLVSRGADAADGWYRDVRRHFFVAAGNPPWPPGMSRIEDADAAMRARGAEVRTLGDVHNESSTSIAEVLEAMERGVWAACWAIDEETRRAAVAATRDWARGEYGDLDLPRRHRQHSDWRSYRLPA